MYDSKRSNRALLLKIKEPMMAGSHADTNPASVYFNENWQRYLNSISYNTLYHREMLHALRLFLATKMGEHPFTFIDVGCGDSSTIIPVLQDFPITKYLGIDAAKDVLIKASENLKKLPCEIELIGDNMSSAMVDLTSPVDVIYTSYAVHHLSLPEKIDFIAACKQKLKPQGYLLMVDGVLAPKKTRDEWLDALQTRMKETISCSEQEIFSRMEHPRSDDFPESIATFRRIAKKQCWADFQVLIDKEIFAFMVFSKE